MKLVIAIVQPARLNAVREALEKIEVARMTVCDAQGFGQQLGQSGDVWGQKQRGTLLRKIALEIVVNDDFLERTIEMISNVTRTGPEASIGDGKIFVLPIDETLRISDCVDGPGAV